MLDVLEQIKRVAKWAPDSSLCDRGYRGRKKAEGTEIVIPDARPKKSLSHYEKLKQRKRFRKRAGIEGVIGHLKADHRLDRNFLWPI